jgi:tetrapyrrole methylase family protein / MazG family protein
MPDRPVPCHPITVVGLGPGDPRHLTAAARAALDAAETIWVRTLHHPGCDVFPAGAPIHSCDDVYETAGSFDAVYQGIAARLVEAAHHGPVVYAVPGDPATGESSVVYLCRAAAESGIALEVLPGVSFVGPTLSALGWDALDGLQLADATALALRHYPDLDPDRPALVAQVYSRLVASDLKLVLLASYPPDHPVTLVSAAGTDGQRVATVPLHRLDHLDAFDDLTTVAVPALPRAGSVLTLAEVVARLRAPDGCPWDREQTHESLRPFLLEEAYEVLAALDAGDEAALPDELGDLLLQIVLHAQLGSEEGAFSLPDVVRHITEKIVRRHPHVFGEQHADTPAAVRSLWEEVKAVERVERGVPDDPFAGIPPTLPALARAQAVQRKTASAGRGSPRAHRQADAVAEGALSDVFLAAPPPDPASRADLIARALWAVVAAAEAWGVDAEATLREATRMKLAAISDPPVPDSR